MATKTKTQTEVRRHTHSPAKTPRQDVEPAADADTVAGRLVLCRTAAGLQQKEAAKRLGITAQSLGGLENGTSKKPSALTLLKMRDKLGYDMDYVMRGRGMPLLPNFEEQAKEQALIAIFRELKPENRDAAIDAVQNLRRAQGGASPQDPYPRAPRPRPDDN